MGATSPILSTAKRCQNEETHDDHAERYDEPEHDALGARGTAQRKRHVRHEPEKSVLYEVVIGKLETFPAYARETYERAIPRYVERELRRFLDCGILERGFVRAFCGDCGASIVDAFSCKCRGSCPSCGARRMNQTAANLVDLVLPDQPVRQWVVSLPWDLRLPVARDSALLTAVVRIVVSEIDKLCKRLGAERGACFDG